MDVHDKKKKVKNVAIKLEVCLVFIFFTFCVFGLFVAYELTIFFVFTSSWKAKPIQSPIYSKHGQCFHCYKCKNIILMES